MKPLSKRIYALSAIALAVVLFIALNIVANTWLGTARLDLTRNGLYTVSPGTKETLAKVQEPINLRFYYSRDAATGYAAIVAYAGRIRDLLQEYAALSGGKVVVSEVDPQPFTPAEDEAVAQGLSGAPAQNGDAVYFGLVGTNTLNGHEVIPFFDQAREQYLEYDLSSLVYKLSQPSKPKLGILTALPLESGSGGIAAALSGASHPFAILQQLRGTYDVQMLDTMTDRIPADISTLIVAHPAGFSDATLYAVDQFVLKGGHAIVFVDPLAEVMNQGNQGLPDQGDRSSSTLGPIFKSWGVNYDATKVVTDADLAQQVQVAGPGGQPRVIDYIAWMRMTPANVNASDPVTGNLQQLNIASAGALKPAQGATTKFTPLLTSSTTAALADAMQIRLVQNPDELLRRFAPTGERFNIAARITGPVKTAFPNGAPKPEAKPTEPPGADGEKKDAGPLPAQIQDAKDINVIVIADSDLLDDRFWVQVQNLLGQQVAIPTSDNGAFVMNAVENMMGSNDLISLRTRERSDRPFIVVQQLRRDAERRFLAQEQTLQQKVTQTEASLRALQGQGGEQGQNAPPGQVLSKEQQTQIEKFRRDLVETRASLRQVQANLRRDVENLGTTLAFLNIAVVPIFVAAAALGLALLRGRRRARARGL
ncbi:MAG TPA: Gldg family protein [Micropepsaceae bacterium]|nr:Gldg family protein [Micropepsaceae bacterium]